jgi:predicted RND superfamily exporter protein
VIAELTIHMEETYESVRAHGLSNSAAMEQTLQEVGNWVALPGIALLIGALPFLHDSHEVSTLRSTT